MNRAPTLEDGPTPELISSVRTSLDRILTSKAFLGSERLRRFLRFIVEQKLCNETERIKEYVVAVEVFDKEASFDPRVDPIVRVEAGRLRSKLREYYETEGAADPIRIALPKGGYLPVFQTGNAQALEEAGEESPTSQTLSQVTFRGGNGSQVPRTRSAPTIDLGHLEGPPIEAPKQRYRYAWAAVTVGVMIAFGISYWPSRREAIGTAELPVVVPFTTYSGHEGDPSFSPDGNQVAFVWDGQQNENNDIYIKQIGTESPRRLTTAPNLDFSPAWSPDGQSIAFVRDLAPGKSAIMRISVNGGRERKLAEIDTGRVPLHCRWLCWHPDGRWLAVAIDQESKDAPAAIYLFSPETGERRRLTSPPGHLSADAKVGGDTNPAFSPDGRSIAFVRFSGSGASEVFWLPLQDRLAPDGEPKQLTFSDRLTVTPAWFPDGKSIIYASGSHFHSARLWKISIFEANKPRPVSVSGQGIVFDPMISGTTRRLVYRNAFLDVNIWQNQIIHENKEAATPLKFIPSSMVQENVHYSSDGKAVAFVSYASGSGEIWICDSNGSNAFQLTHLDGPRPDSLNWSPDGREIAFSQLSNGKHDLYTVTVDGGRIRRLTYTRLNEGDPSFSYDGRWIYFSSDRTGGFQIWKMPAAGGDAVQITRNGGRSPQESMDGKVLFYSKSKDSDFGELWKISAEGGPETRVIEGVLRTNFEVKRRGIYYAAQPDGKEPQFLFYDFASGKATRIATPQNDVYWGFSVSPDEKWILSTQGVGAGGSDLVLVENFR